MLGVQFVLESTEGESQIMLEMIGQETAKCYIEEVNGKVDFVDIGYSSSNGIKRISYATESGQESLGSSNTVIYSNSYELDSNTQLIGLYGTVSET